MSLWLCNLGFFLLPVSLLPSSLSPNDRLVAANLRSRWRSGQRQIAFSSICDASCGPITFQDTFYVLARNSQILGNPSDLRKPERGLSYYSTFFSPPDELCSSGDRLLLLLSSILPTGPSAILNTLEEGCLTICSSLNACASVLPPLLNS